MVMKIDKIRITPKWDKSKEQIWTEKFETLGENSKTKIIPFYRRKILLYAAAVVALIVLALPTTAFLYTEQLHTAYGEHRSIVLPDGSEVELNADSRLVYKPLWWKLSRTVELEGEAYFEVEKGSRFDVRSNENIVSVLGTSFNIYSREKKYEVSCLTGKVSVRDKTELVILTPNMQAKMANGKFIIIENNNSLQSIGWTKGEFTFTAVPLVEALKEIERQYNVKIEKPKNSDYLYTGTFSKKESPKEVLEIVGKPFDLKLKIIE